VFFFDKAEYVIQVVKPHKCLDFPNLWRFLGSDGSFQATFLKIDEATCRRLVVQATGRLPETVPLPRVETD